VKNTAQLHINVLKARTVDDTPRCYDIHKVAPRDGNTTCDGLCCSTKPVSRLIVYFLESLYDGELVRDRTRLRFNFAVIIIIVGIICYECYVHRAIFCASCYTSLLATCIMRFTVGFM
jgi:hypothetical protein